MKILTNKLRAQQTVCFLIGPDHDRQDWAQFFEQAGYNIQVFKNPSVLFDYLKEFKPFLVVLETSALRSKLSQWVTNMLSLRPDQHWLVMAPIDQYPILSTYQNRFLKDFISIDQPYFKERALWALDRQLETHQLKNQSTLDFIETVNQKIPIVIDSFNMETYLELRIREAGIKSLPFSILALKLDDRSEIQDFWGEEILKKSQELLMTLCQQKWKHENTHQIDQFVFLTINQSTAKLLSEIQSLQSEIQTQGREKFGFQFSISGGISEWNVHSDHLQNLKPLAIEACQNMQLKGGGRVGVPKPLKKDHRGDLPQNLG